MPAFPGRHKARTPYWLRFALLLGSMGAITAAFVLIVLPQRFVLQAGLIESGITFAASELPFWLAEQRPMVEPPVSLLAQPVLLGPAQVFWSNVMPRLEAEDYDAAIPMFRQYLSDHPDDWDVWREFAIALTRTGRVDEAKEVYGRLIVESAETFDKLSLARLLRDGGEHSRSLALYSELLAADSTDLDLYYEFAQSLVWAGRYREAEQAYRLLLEADPNSYQKRLELAQVLYWNGYLVNALALLRDLPATVQSAPEAAGLRDHIDSLLVASLPIGETTVERARRAVGALDYSAATVLYQTALHRDLRNQELLLEWADFLQYHASDLVSARDALRQLALLRDLSAAERYRLARLHVWTGEELVARSLLDDLVAEHPNEGRAWALLGDIHLWQGSRAEATRAYRRALAIDPTDEQALNGLATVRSQTADLLAQRETPSIGPELLYFRDSDDFERLDLVARANLLQANSNLAIRAGYRRIQGNRLNGAAATEQGPFAEVEFAHWWRLGTVRTSISTGAEQFNLTGTEPTLEARVEVPDLNGTALQASFTHGRAFKQTATLESLEGEVLSDDLQASAYRQVSDRWSVNGNAGLATLHGSHDTNVRLNVAVSARRQVSQLVDAALVSQFLSFSGSAADSLDRRLYWDPGLFWSNGLQLGLRTKPQNHWSGYIRFTPGLALVNERATDGIELVPQFASEAGASWETERIRFRTDLAYLRGREGDYNSLGLTAVFSVKH